MKQELISAGTKIPLLKSLNSSDNNKVAIATFIMFIGDVSIDLLKGMSEPQLEAVLHIEGPLFILAGAGLGYHCKYPSYDEMFN